MDGSRVELEDFPRSIVLGGCKGSIGRELQDDVDTGFLRSYSIITFFFTTMNIRKGYQKTAIWVFVPIKASKLIKMGHY